MVFTFKVPPAYWYEEAYCGKDINMSFIYIANSVGENGPVIQKVVYYSKHTAFDTNFFQFKN